MSGMSTSMSGMSTSMSGMSTPMNGMGGMDGTGGMDGMGMVMYFHAGTEEYILFEQLRTYTKAQFAGACIVVFIMGVLYEVMKFGREELLKRHNISVAMVLLHGTHEEKAEAVSSSNRMFSRIHLVQTLLHAIQIFFSYCLMLIFMTYNAYLCLSLILGATMGYFFTGWKRTQVADQNEHCH